MDENVDDDDDNNIHCNSIYRYGVHIKNIFYSIRNNIQIAAIFSLFIQILHKARLILHRNLDRRFN